VKAIEVTIGEKSLRTRITNELWAELEEYIAREYNSRRGSLGLVVELALAQYLERHRNGEKP